MRQVRRYGSGTVFVLWLGVVGLGGVFASGCSKNVVGPEPRAESNTQQTKPYGPPYIWDQD